MDAASRSGNERWFDTRLAWDGLDRDSAMNLLSGQPRYTSATEPFWAQSLRSLAEFLVEYRGPVALGEHWAADVPFGYAFDPLIEFGLLQLPVSRRGHSDVLVTSLRRDLLLRLFEVCSLTLGEEFLQWRKRAGVLDVLLQLPPEELQHEHYDAFVRQLNSGGWIELFTVYPVLARLIATTIEFWVADTADFFAAYERDRQELAVRFFRGKDPGTLVDVQGSVSDLHRNGRAVKILTFESGRKLVYKPKSLAIDAAWAELVRWLAERNPKLDLSAPAIWVQPEYGWVEFVEHTHCADRDAVKRFYHREGALAFLAYLVKATDLHHENLIASGEHLVPIDLETLFSHDPAEPTSLAAGDQRLLNSVLRSGLLPNWELMGGAAFDMSGLGTFAEGQSGARAAEWKHPNSDHMHLALVTGGVPVEHNMPRLAESPVNPDEFVGDVELGFRTAYTTVVRYRGELLSPDSPLSQFAEVKVRVVLRPTQVYARLLKRSVAPRLLRHGIDRSLEFEGLSRHVLQAGERHGCRKFFSAELAALEQFDVPYFDALTSNTDVLSASTVSQGLLTGPSYDAVRNHILHLSEADCEFQLELIRGAFAARVMRPPDSASAVVVPVTPRPAGPVMGATDFVAEAQLLAHELQARVLRDDHGGANWIGLQSLRTGERYSIQPLGNSLYGGVSGVALFFAGLHVLTGDVTAEELAIAATRTLRSRLFPAGMDPQRAQSAGIADGIGGGSGLGSTLYGLSALSGMLRDSTLLDDGLRLARHLTADVIASDVNLDVMSGTAGALLGLLALWRSTSDRGALQRAILCADHLVRQQEQAGDYGAWRTGHPRHLCGFSHGASGIAYALVRLYREHPDPRYLDAAMKAFAFEHSVYSPEHKNWPDFREWEPGRPPVFRSGWCHGAPGIGLARLGSLPVIDDPLLRLDAEAALDSVISCDSYPLDSVCCGEFGMTELLATAVRLGQESWSQVARERASRVVRAAMQRRSEHGGHGYLLGGCTQDGRFSIGFFQGLAGIGYNLLRLAAPDRLPCVVLWD